MTLLNRTQSERADDIPLIIHWLQQMEIASMIDEELPPPHGNRKGLSYGELSSGVTIVARRQT